MKERSLPTARVRFPVQNHHRHHGIMNKQLGSFKLLVIFLILLAVYVAGACYQGFFVNLDMEKTDQSAYMDYAKRMKTTHYEYIGDRNRMPVYPFLQSLFYNQKLTDEEFFWRGKLVNIILSIVLLLVLYAILRRFLNELESQVFILITAFTVFIYKAGYFQCELLFYFLNFCVFLFFLRCMKQPSLWVGALSGAVAALAWLTKAAIIPAVIAVLFFYIIRNIALPIIDIFTERENSSNKFIKILKYFCILIIFISVFLLTLSPYIRTSKKIFGHYFYNVNSTFYIWYDSWEEVKKGTRAHGDRIGWPQMPENETPSFTKYFKEHSIEQFLYRLAIGSCIVMGSALSSYGYLKYFSIYLFVCLFTFFKRHDDVLVLIRKNGNSVIFIYLITYFIGYFLLYGFFSFITHGPRLFLAQFLPAMFTLFCFFKKIKVNMHMNSINLCINNDKMHLIICYILIFDILFNMPFNIRYYTGD